MIARIHTVWDSDLAINYPKLLDYFNVEQIEDNWQRYIVVDVKLDDISKIMEITSYPVIIDKDICHVNFNPNGRLPNSIAWDITIYDDYFE